MVMIEKEIRVIQESLDDLDDVANDSWWYLEGYRDVLNGHPSYFTLSSQQSYQQSYLMGYRDAEGDLS